MSFRSHHAARLALVAALALAAGCAGLQPPLPGLTVTTVAGGLDIPWSLAFVPDGRLFFTERDSGRVRVIVGGVLQPTPVVTLPVCCGSGEGGALGLVPDPDFAANGYLYAFYTHLQTGVPRNRIERLVVTGNTATRDLILLDGIPGSSDRHNGGRLKVGPDGMLYATTGDTNDLTLPQNGVSLAGKILRLTRTGQIPPDNPLPGSYVYTLGHRNAQGLAWDVSRTLYSTEHGASRNDEVNLIRPGANYGWPLYEGTATAPGYVAPFYVFLADTCAPSGATFVRSTLIPEWNGDLLFTCLRGVHLHRLRLAGPGSDVVVQDERLYEGAYGRLRDVTVGPDGAVYVSTSNGGGADRILRIGR